MSNAAQHHKVNYIEFSTTDIARTKKFYSEVFGWGFQDWGPDYIDSSAEIAGLALGFKRGEAGQSQPNYAPLIVFYSADLKATEAAIVAAGGSIVVPIFEFPGGRRFHFSDGLGNILGVWSE
jgi:predicted enzyme related to lactoylglutathione lyase